MTLFVALAATVANLRLLKGQRSGLWVAYVTLGLTLFEQWLRVDENWSPAALFWVLALGSVAYDSCYVFAILCVRKLTVAPSVSEVGHR